MTTHLLDEAIKVIPNQQILINVVSRRVRQLAQGHRPMVEVGARFDYADIALREVIEGKISWEAVEVTEEPTEIESSFSFPSGDSDVAGTIEPASV